MSKAAITTMLALGLSMGAATGGNPGYRQTYVSWAGSRGTARHPAARLRRAAGRRGGTARGRGGTAGGRRGASGRGRQSRLLRTAGLRPGLPAVLPAALVWNRGGRCRPRHHPDGCRRRYGAGLCAGPRLVLVLGRPVPDQRLLGLLRSSVLNGRAGHRYGEGVGGSARRRLSFSEKAIASAEAQLAAGMAAGRGVKAAARAASKPYRRTVRADRRRLTRPHAR